MATSRQKTKGRRNRERFVGIPISLWNHPDFFVLSGRAMKLLIDVAGQYNGRNNGDLCITMKVMRGRAWTSSDQLYKARNELIDRDLIRLSRQGGRNLCSLYAVTWQGVDECRGKHDLRTSDTPLRKFSIELAAPNSGVSQSAVRSV